MKPHLDRAIDEHALSPVERLLLAVAEFEPEAPAPGLLSSGGVLMLLAEDAQRRRRRTVRARMAAFTGLMAGTAVCSASLVLALTQSSRPGQGAGTASAPAPKEMRETKEKVVASAAISEAPPQAKASAPGRPRRTVRRRRTRGQAWAAKREATSAAVWTEQTVEHRMTGLLADAWIVEPQADGSLQLQPAIIDLPTDRLPAADACGPIGSEAPPGPAADEVSPVAPAEEPR